MPRRPPVFSCPRWRFTSRNTTYSYRATAVLIVSLVTFRGGTFTSTAVLGTCPVLLLIPGTILPGNILRILLHTSSVCTHHMVHITPYVDDQRLELVYVYDVPLLSCVGVV